MLKSISDSLKRDNLFEFEFIENISNSFLLFKTLSNKVMSVNKDKRAIANPQLYKLVRDIDYFQNALFQPFNLN